MTVTAVQFEELDEDACYGLLASVPVGRVVATSGALPLVVPVTFALDGHSIIFRTTSSGRLAAATRGSVVAFEADVLEAPTCTGWSVVVTGVASPITDVSDVLRAEQLGLVPWAPGVRDHFVRISPGLVTGRRVAAVG